jgi:hypothetical protein
MTCNCIEEVENLYKKQLQNDTKNCSEVTSLYLQKTHFNNIGCITSSKVLYIYRNKKGIEKKGESIIIHNFCPFCGALTK